MITLPEIWKLISYPGIHHYEVSNAGRVRRAINRSTHQSVKHRDDERWRYLQPSLARGGVIVTLRHGGDDGSYSRYFMHRLVWQTFEGPIPEGMAVVHKDGDPTHNDLGNLKLVDRAKYVGDLLRGRPRPTFQGSNSPIASIDEDTARIVKERLDAAPRTPSGRRPRGLCTDIADDLGISKHVVHSISKGKSWRHV